MEGAREALAGIDVASSAKSISNGPALAATSDGAAPIRRLATAAHGS